HRNNPKRFQGIQSSRCPDYYLGPELRNRTDEKEYRRLSGKPCFEPEIGHRSIAFESTDSCSAYQRAAGQTCRPRRKNRNNVAKICIADYAAGSQSKPTRAKGRRKIKKLATAVVDKPADGCGA